jgi:hypothetical protein
MSETLIKVIVNCSTGEQTIVPLTAEEIAQLETDRVEFQATQAAAEAEAQAKAAAKQSAQDKLKALGLSDIEIAAITGA